MAEYDLVDDPSFRDNYKDGFDTTERYFHNYTQGEGISTLEAAIAALFATLVTIFCGFFTDFNLVLAFMTAAIAGLCLTFYISHQSFDDKKMQTWIADHTFRRGTHRQEIINDRRVPFGRVVRTTGRIGYLLPQDHFSSPEGGAR
jgi:hypothetical protein